MRATSVLRLGAPALIPILFAAFPLLSLYADNQTELELGALRWPLLVCGLAGTGLYVPLLLVLRDWRRAAAIASATVAAFFFYGLYSWALWLWLLLFVVAVAVVVLIPARGLGALALGLTVAAVVLIGGQVARIASYESNNPGLSSGDPAVWPTALTQPTLRAGAPRPDIYVLIPDDYARQDILRHYFHYDNRPFLRALRRRGFVIAPGSRSPYSDSEMNIAAEVNMDYLSRLPAILGKTSKDVRPVRRLIEDSRASRIVRSLGYRYVHIDSDEVTWGERNPQISHVATPDSFGTLWMQQSILGKVGGRVGFDDGAVNERFRKTIRSAFSSLHDVPAKPSPKFVLFHTLMPHDPYIFGPRGENSTFPDHSEEGHTRKIGMRYYARQARYVETLMLRAIDTIRARSRRPPVILLQADEGFEANEKDWGEKAVRDIRVKGISAALLPGKPKVRLPDSLNTVNTLRFVFNEYFHAGYPMLRSASYPEGDLPYQFEEMRVRGLIR